MNYLVIDFGGTLAKYSVMTEDSAVISQGEKPAPLSSRTEFLDFICELFEKENGIRPLSGIAISMPGVIDADVGYIKTAGAYEHLYEMDLTGELRGRIPVPVSVENDGKCGALAEVWKGNLSENDDGAVIILGTGIAGGIIKGRHIHRGKSLAAGEISSFILSDRVEIENCAAGICSTAGLLYRAMYALGIDVKKSPYHKNYGGLLDTKGQVFSALNEDPQYDKGMDGYRFFSLLEAGNEVVERCYDDFIENLCTLAFNIQVVFAPEKIVVGGGICRQPRLIPDIQARMAQKIDRMKEFLPVIDCVIDVCKFGNEANQYGALYHFLELYAQGC